MRDKSKFIAFMLSVIPGLSHFYIGLKERAIIFFMVTLGALLGCVGLAGLTSSEGFIVLFIVIYLVIWLIALIDVFSAWKKLELRELYNGEATDMNNTVIDKKFNKKTVTLALSIIPGAGHMYLGQMEKGLIIMGAFFFSVFFMGWLGISLLLFLLPLIWFYSFFDAMHTVDENTEDVDYKEINLPAIKPEWVGFGLIGLGVVIVLERILYPLINWEIRRYVQTSIVSLVFIVLGIFILNKNKHVGIEESDTKEDEDNEE